jgi:hypothetical protein
VQTLLSPFEGVASRIDRILNRCGDRVKTGSVLFDERGEQHARQVAHRDLKPVDTALAPTTARGAAAATADDSSRASPIAEPMTAALSRLSIQEGR